MIRIQPLISFCLLRQRIAYLAIGLSLLVALPLRAATGGSISGTLTDPSGAVITGATLTATDAVTGTQFKATSDDKGFYSFPSLPVGKYDLRIEADGFKRYTKTGLVIDADGALKVNVVLEIGASTQTVTVSATAVQLDTVSNEMGEVVTGKTMTAVPLNGRSYTDLLAIQPAVIPITSMQSNSIVMAGVTGAIDPSGELNPGNLSINGAQESANGFLVNGSDVQEHMNGGTSIIPNLDSIAEFRVLTSNFDAQYGNYNGGIVNVITKSGTDRFHGDAFEFLRNTDLDANTYFNKQTTPVTPRPKFIQNQFGGTIGGPIRREKAFFFGDYQGTRTSQGIETGLIGVPSLQDRSGDLSDVASSLTGTVSGPYMASRLAQRLGYPVQQGEAYYTSGCTLSSDCVFPNAVIPTSAWSAPAQHLLQYIPSPNSANNVFSTSAYAQTTRDDKAGLRFDLNTRYGLFSPYYFIDDYSLSDPYPTAEGGASVPGFQATTRGRAQLITLGNTRTFGANAVNDAHVSLMRNFNAIGYPVGGVGVSLASQGFVTGPGTPGIVPLAPSIEGVENIVFNNFTMGETTTGVTQANNTLQWNDTFSRVIGSHTMRAGAQFHYDQINLAPDATFNGTFTFTGSETGSDFADFLIGAPSDYTQSSGRNFYLRNHYLGLFAQDSWQARPNLTINYGLRWDVLPYWYEKYNQLETYVAGQQSVVFPGAPRGLVFPGDPGIPRTIFPTKYDHFSPRIGLAYSPGSQSGILRRLFGDGGTTSIRAGYGIYYTAFQGLSAGVLYAVAPYGDTYDSPAPPVFSEPFITSSNGANNGQPFPMNYPPFGTSASHPDNSVDWSKLLPINCLPSPDPRNTVPYSEQYMFSVERKLSANTLLSLAYVGNEGHHLLVLQDINPGNPALCLSLSKTSEVAPGSPTCGPFEESSTFVTASGQVIKGTRTAGQGSNYGDNDAQRTIGNSNFNALEATLRQSEAHSSFLISYTYSKSIDQSSNLGEPVNPFNNPDTRLTRAISAFDMTQNFVATYQYDLPFDRLLRGYNRLTDGWAISGTTRFSSGLPVTLYNNTDSSLLGTSTNGVNNNLLDTPECSPGNLEINTNPRNGRPEFNTALFSIPQLGQLGNCKRRFFYGPGIENFDMALRKNLPLWESKSLQIRLEAFNVFNHAQFYGPAAVQGSITSSTFGQVISAQAPRLVQLGAKFNF